MTAAHGRAAAILEKDRSMAELNDYYTLWAHQIKTPISAMNLLLQEEGTVDKKELAAQLLRLNSMWIWYCSICARKIYRGSHIEGLFCR